VGEGLVDLILKLATPDRFTSGTVTFWTTCLHHEASDNSMEQFVIIVPVLGMSCEILHSERALRTVQMQVDLSHGSINDALSRQLDSLFLRRFLLR